MLLRVCGWHQFLPPLLLSSGKGFREKRGEAHTIERQRVLEVEAWLSVLLCLYVHACVWFRCALPMNENLRSLAAFLVLGGFEVLLCTHTLDQPTADKRLRESLLL